MEKQITLLTVIRDHIVNWWKIKNKVDEEKIQTAPKYDLAGLLTSDSFIDAEITASRECDLLYRGRQGNHGEWKKYICPCGSDDVRFVKRYHKIDIPEDKGVLHNFQVKAAVDLGITPEQNWDICKQGKVIAYNLMGKCRVCNKEFMVHAEFEHNQIRVY